MRRFRLERRAPARHGRGWEVRVVKFFTEEEEESRGGREEVDNLVD